MKRAAQQTCHANGKRSVRRNIADVLRTLSFRALARSVLPALGALKKYWEEVQNIRVLESECYGKREDPISFRWARQQAVEITNQMLD